MGRYDLWVTVRSSLDDPWIDPVPLGTPINTAADEGAPSLSPDDGTLYFASRREGGLGGWDQYQVALPPLIPDSQSTGP
jgi:hypothetical protein